MTTSCSMWGARSMRCPCARSTAPTRFIRCCNWPCPISAMAAACSIFSARSVIRERLRLIVNRYEKGGRLRLADLEQALGAEVVHTVPNDYLAATDSVNQGIPLLQLSRSSSVARNLAELVELVTARRVTESRGLFDRLFSRNEV